MRAPGWARSPGHSLGHTRALLLTHGLTLGQLQSGMRPRACQGQREEGNGALELKPWPRKATVFQPSFPIPDSQGAEPSVSNLESVMRTSSCLSFSAW